MLLSQKLNQLLKDTHKEVALSDEMMIGFIECKKHAEKIERALTKIANWELPETGKFWDKEKTRPTNYETENGSNGARDYIKSIASEALSVGEIVKVF